MVAGRLLSVVGTCVVASASVALAAPTKGAAPATSAGTGSGSGSGSGSAAGSGSGSAEAGSAQQMAEDTKPADERGVDENPGAPHAVGTEEQVVKVAAPTKPVGYPIQEALRPITLPRYMLEVRLDPHMETGDGSSIPYEMTTTLRGRFGITDKIQVGVTYNAAAIYTDPAIMAKSYSLNGGKAFGVDVTYLVRDWVGARIGIPMYASPDAVSVDFGAPLKFKFGDKFAIGGLDDVFNIKIDNFAPSFYNEYYNAVSGYSATHGTEVPAGILTIAAYAVYQLQRDLAVFGRFGDQDFLGGASGNAGANQLGGNTEFLYGGLQWSPSPSFDVGASIGWDDLGHIGSFAPAAFAALRM
jgi:hypothetical protein